ncbi:MAG: hypothetical protein RMJ59_00035 [Candidatus Nitrosocaldus sp.]|nr:hypothetical protein [Candidatus Nitrosocaldus sp.]MDW8274756.1 hypothetical protein [Candidatus Nitrosocaldus sp.]
MHNPSVGRDGRADLWVFHERVMHGDESVEESWIVIVERSRYSLFGFKVVQNESYTYPGYPGYVVSSVTALDSLAAAAEMERLQSRGDVRHARVEVSDEEADSWYGMLANLSDITSRVLNQARGMVSSVEAVH